MAVLRRVLVARLDSLGDVLSAGPAVRAVAARGQVTMLVRTGLGEAAQLLPWVHDVIDYDAPWVQFDPPPVVPTPSPSCSALSRSGASTLHSC